MRKVGRRRVFINGEEEWVDGGIEKVEGGLGERKKVCWGEWRREKEGLQVIIMRQSTE